MKFLFLQDHLLNESLPVTELVALLRQEGHQSFLWIEREDKCLREKIRCTKPDAVVLPADVGNEQRVSRFVRLTRQHTKAPIIMIGSLPTLSISEAFSMKADFYICGEAEHAFQSLLPVLNSKRAKGKPSPAPGVYAHHNLNLSSFQLARPWEDLDALPMPDRHFYFQYRVLGQFPVKKFVTGRGCPLSCSFCYITPIKKMQKGNPYLRQKSPERVAEEILWVKKRYPLSFVHFSDDTFSYNKNWLIRFCELYARKIRLPFDCNTVANFLDEEALDALREANCKGIAVGVEVGDEKVRIRELNKPVRNDRLLWLARQMEKRKLKLITFNMIGLPGKPSSFDLQTVEFNRMLGAAIARVQLAYPMPQTAWTEKLASRRGLPAATKKGSENTFYQLKKGFSFMQKTPFLPWKRWLGHPALNVWMPLLGLYSAWLEKQFYEIALADAVRIFLHTGGMENRTKNINLSLP